MLSKLVCLASFVQEYLKLLQRQRQQMFSITCASSFHALQSSQVDCCFHECVRDFKLKTLE